MPGKDTSYVVLSGGVGGAKLVLGLRDCLESQQLQVIANTGDDFEHIGLPISPDIDTLIYTLAGLANPATGWGLTDETWNCMAQLEKLGGETWFRLGDRDMATHLQRRELLANGNNLSDATTTLAKALNVDTAIWPMSDQKVRTVVHTTDGPLEFQQYFVRFQAQPIATGFEYTGHAAAQASAGALKALQAESLGAIILTPSNPWLSIEPILSVNEIKNAIAACGKPVVAVSPIVGGKAIKGPTAKLMQETGIEVSALGIAKHYGDLLDGLVIDNQDIEHRDAIEAMGIKVKTANTIMLTQQDKSALADAVLRFAAELSGGSQT
jgi:LPPG:FO 2-phospho-L-lactate transferase